MTWPRHPRPKGGARPVDSQPRSLSRSIQSSGSGGQKAAVALQGQITQLKKALEAAEAGRTAAEKETEEVKSKLADAREQGRRVWPRNATRCSTSAMTPYAS